MIVVKALLPQSSGLRIDFLQLLQAKSNHTDKSFVKSLNDQLGSKEALKTLKL